MAKSLTFSEAAARFGPLVTTDVTAEDAIQEALERIYEMGRYRGTTEELVIPTESFVLDPVSGETYVYFPRNNYSAAIAFRNSKKGTEKRGWNIVDRSVLYRDSVSFHHVGDRNFVNLGDVIYNNLDHIKYRCPLESWSMIDGPFVAHLKNNCPTFADDDLITIATVGALKHAVQAVCYEWVNEEGLAESSWARFNRAMMSDEFLTDGPVNYVGTPYGF